MVLTAAWDGYLRTETLLHAVCISLLMFCTANLSFSANNNSTGWSPPQIQASMAAAMLVDEQILTSPSTVMHQTCLVLWTWRKLADETNAKNAHMISQDYPYAKDEYKLIIAICRTRMTILEQEMNADG